MLRFFAILWDASSATHASAARVLIDRLRGFSPAWQATVSHPGFAVYCSSERPVTEAGVAADIHLLRGGRGAVLGALFENPASNTHSGRQPVLDDRASTRIIHSRGRYLIEAFWGRYVAFFYDEASRSKYILRDPTGGMPCFSASLDGVSVFFSLFDDYRLVARRPLSINWSYLAARACHPWRHEARETGLSGIANRIAGECVECRAGREERLVLWDPVRIAADTPIESPREAQEALRCAVRSVTHAWTAKYPGILLLLSGGFDSSVVLSFVRDAPSQPVLNCLNRYSDGALSDERPYARIAAARATVNLIERERDSKLDLRGVMTVRASPLPAAVVQAYELGPTEIEIATCTGASAIFGGQQGDQLFYESPLGLTAADYVFDHGVRAEALNIGLQAAISEHVSIWKYMGWAARYGLFRRPYDPIEQHLSQRQLVSRNIVDDGALQRRFGHPWLASLGEVGPGKANQIATIRSPLEYYDPFAATDAPERVYPLCSQPLIEVCLRIPTYLLTRGGRERALAREAFCKDIPVEISNRASKGDMDDHYHRMIAVNLPFLREVLLNGELIGQGIADKARLTAVLSADISRVPAVELFDLVSMEAWMSSISRAQH